MKISQDFIDQIKAEIPELPQQKRERLSSEYGLDLNTIEIFISQKALGEYFEKVVSELDSLAKEEDELFLKRDREKAIKLITNYLISDLQGLLAQRNLDIESPAFKITPENFAELIFLILQGKISSKIAKEVLAKMVEQGGDPSQIIEAMNLSLVTNVSIIEQIAQKVLENNPKAVQDFKKGKENALQFLIGEVMRETKGRADPQKARDVLTQKLKALL